MNILLTGGAGYIGSHTAVVLSQAGHEVVLLDNFCNSQKNVLACFKRILGKELICVEGNVRNRGLVASTLKDYEINAVIHFAALKAVGESVEKPIEYYANNVEGTISLLEAMKAVGVKTMVFSSSAAVYGTPQYLPIDEEHPVNPKSPYGRSKLHIEEMLRDLAYSDPDWRICCLRYFNPVGAHSSGLIGENPSVPPSNLVPYMSRVANGEISHLKIYGNDYETKDGTGVRDYIHIADLAKGHLAALNYLKMNSGFYIFNLGTGNGASVREVIMAFEAATGKNIFIRNVARRPGDVAISYADPSKAVSVLDWRATQSLTEMCLSAWNFQKALK